MKERFWNFWADLREGDTFGNTYQTVIDALKGSSYRGVANVAFKSCLDKVFSYLVNDYWALELKNQNMPLPNYDPRYPVGKLGSRSLRSAQEPPIAQRRQTLKRRRFVK